MYYDPHLTIVLLTISIIIMVLVMTCPNTRAVNAQNTELERAVSQTQIEDNIIKGEDSSNVFLLSTPDAEGSDSKGNDVECQDDPNQDVKDCSTTKSDHNNKEMQSSTDILLPFP